MANDNAAVSGLCETPTTIVMAGAMIALPFVTIISTRTQLIAPCEFLAALPKYADKGNTLSSSVVHS